MVNLLHGNIALKKQLSNVIWTIIHSGQSVSKGILNTKNWLTTAASQIVGGNYVVTTQKAFSILSFTRSNHVLYPYVLNALTGVRGAISSWAGCIAQR